MLGARRQAGDTLIEVLFAITVFSMVIVATLSLMNQGTAAARRSVETTLVREQIDGQAEALRFMHESYVANYQSGASYNVTDAATSPAEEYFKVIERIKTTNRTAATQFSNLNTCPAAVPGGGFIINSRTARLVTATANLQRAATGYARLTYAPGNNASVTSNGIWIEGIRTAQESAASGSLTKNAGFIDFHIRACWSVPGQDKPMSMGTIVRLYEPRG